MYGSSCKVETTVSRHPASSYLLVDSLDRYGKEFPNGSTFTSSSDWTLNFQSALVQGYVKRMCLTQVGFQWNIPTILANYNDVLIIAFTGQTSNVIILTPGYYTPTTLAAMIQEKLLTAFPTLTTITVIYDPTVGAFVINSGNPAVATIVFPAGASTTPIALRHARFLITTGLINVTVGAGGPPAIVVGGVPTMLATRWVDICSAYLTKYQKIKDGTTLAINPRSDMLCRLFAVSPNTRYSISENDSPGSTPFSLVQDMNNPKFFEWSPDEYIINFDIQVRDEYGEILPVSPQFCSEYQLTFLVSET
jgi:hypothetical protein